MAEIGIDIAKAATLLKAGEVIGIPTETVYGLGGNAFDSEAVVKIFEVKNRPRFNPMIVHTHSLAGAREFVNHFPKVAIQLADRFWPGPLTFLLPKSKQVPDLVTAGSDLVGVRVPSHPLTLQLLRSLDFPLAAPSANPFGYISPTTAQHVEDQLGNKIPYILDGGPTTIGVESTIIGFDQDDKPVIFRPGGVGIEAIEKFAGSVTWAKPDSETPESPGRLKSHYAPGGKVKLGMISEMLNEVNPKQTGILSFQHYYPGIPKHQQVILAPGGEMAEAARNLFSALRRLDRLGLSLILAEQVEDKGLGRAINDRLRRAAAE